MNVDGGDDNSRNAGEGGEVVPFPGGRHPSQWPGEPPYDREEGDPVPLPFDEPDQAAGDYEPLPEQEHSGSTLDLDARRAEESAEADGDDSSVDEEPGEAAEEQDDEEGEVEDQAEYTPFGVEDLK